MRSRWLGALVVPICIFSTGCGRSIADTPKMTSIRFFDPAPSAGPSPSSSVTTSPGTPTSVAAESRTPTSAASTAGDSGSSSQAAGSQSVCGAPIKYSVFEANAYGSDWSKADNLIAFNQQASDGYYHIYTVNPNGANKRQVGLGSSTFPQRTTGSPAWYPTGTYMAFVAEKTSSLPGSLAGDTFGATPGWGDYSDLWVSTADGSRAWQLTDLPVGANDGVILPQFSPNGQLLEWTEKSQGSNGADFVIKVARFNIASDGTPSLTDIQTIAPGGSAFPNEFIETGGFSADSSQMLFTSNFQNHIWAQSQIYVLNLGSGVITRLTNWNSYDEHPRFTPSGQVIWMSDADQPAGHSSGDDWWIMNANGSDPHKLTYFNDPSYPEYFGSAVWATVVDTDSWSPDGSYFYGDLELNLITSQSDILRVSLTCK